ncbi:MAG: hypothetical protein WDM88_07760 [Galbitalea sp.]
MNPDAGRGPAGAAWGDPTILHDYLQHEIYDDLEPEEQEVLLTMGVSPLATPALVSAIGDIPDSTATLRSLALHNRMLHRDSMDARGRVWYRVQPLFGAFLRDRISEANPDLLEQMTARARELARRTRRCVRALRIALSPENPTLVDSILRRRGYDVHERRPLGRTARADAAGRQSHGLRPVRAAHDGLRGPPAR